MPKSRKRGGEKAHRKRIQKRNEMLGNLKHKYTKLFNERLKEAIEKKENENTNNKGI